MIIIDVVIYIKTHIVNSVTKSIYLETDQIIKYQANIMENFKKLRFKIQKMIIKIDIIVFKD